MYLLKGIVVVISWLLASQTSWAQKPNPVAKLTWVEMENVPIRTWRAIDGDTDTVASPVDKGILFRTAISCPADSVHAKLVTSWLLNTSIAYRGRACSGENWIAISTQPVHPDFINNLPAPLRQHYLATTKPRQ